MSGELDRGDDRQPGTALRHDSYRDDKDDSMPPKLRDLITELERAGFVDRGGKGSHRNFVHPAVKKPVTLSGKPGDDAKQYQLRAVRLALEELRK